MSYKKKELNIFISFKLKKKKQHKNLHKPPTNSKPLKIKISTYIYELLSHNKSKHKKDITLKYS
jgi:hypothetical protein